MFETLKNEIINDKIEQHTTQSNDTELRRKVKEFKKLNDLNYCLYFGLTMNLFSLYFVYNKKHINRRIYFFLFGASLIFSFSNSHFYYKCKKNMIEKYNIPEDKFNLYADTYSSLYFNNDGIQNYFKDR